MKEFIPESPVVEAPERPDPIDPAILDGLLARVATTTGSDRDLDGELWWTFCRRNAEHTYWTAAMGMPRELGPGKPPGGLGWLAVTIHAPPCTEKVDAVLRLADLALPGWPEHTAAVFTDRPAHLVSIKRHFAGDWCGRIYRAGDGASWENIAPSPALALLAALLRAIRAERLGEAATPASQSPGMNPPSPEPTVEVK